jgi:glycosyltransferase involved in cell wall biosynthesis
MNKTIIYLIHSLPSGGSENVFLRTLPKIKKAKCIILTLRGKGSLFPKFLESGITVIEIGQKNFFDLKSYSRTLKILDDIKPDLIITNLLHADIYGRFFIQVFSKYKVVPYLQTTYNFKRYWPARFFEKTTKYFVKNYLANSEAVKKFYIEKFNLNEKKIVVIPNGIDVKFYSDVVRDKNLRNNLGIKEEETAIICVANLHVNKGHRYLLEAFENTYKENKDIKLLFVGDGDEKNNLLEQIKKYNSRNSILFLGTRSDVPAILKVSEIFVLPTFFEGLSNSIMEAMASSLPVITTDIPENKELVENDVSGLLCSIENSSCLSTKMVSLINDTQKRKQLGEKAFKKIQEKKFKRTMKYPPLLKSGKNILKIFKNKHPKPME